MYYVYILYNFTLQRHYIGYSADLKERIATHRRSHVKSTAHNGAWNLVWYGAFSSKRKALDFEKYLKTGSGFAFRNTRLV